MIGLTQDFHLSVKMIRALGRTHILKKMEKMRSIKPNASPTGHGGKETTPTIIPDHASLDMLLEEVQWYEDFEREYYQTHVFNCEDPR